MYTRVEFIVLICMQGFVKETDPVDQCPPKRAEWNGIHCALPGIKSIHCIARPQRMCGSAGYGLGGPCIFSRMYLPYTADVIALRGAMCADATLHIFWDGHRMRIQADDE